jgi:hypothetical protein
LDTYHVVLYVHLLSLFVGIGAAAILSACLFGLRGARTLEQAVPWGMMAAKAEKGFPIAILGLFATGAYMTSKFWTWDTGWIWPSIVGLVIVSTQGPLWGGRTARKLEHALKENGPGALGEVPRRLTRSPGLWVAEFANIGVVLGVVWNMSQKPGTASAIAAVVIGYVVGALVAWPFTRQPAVESAPAAEPGT